MRICHEINILVQTTGGNASYLNGKSESPNKNMSNIAIDLLIITDTIKKVVT